MNGESNRITGSTIPNRLIGALETTANDIEDFVEDLVGGKGNGDGKSHLTEVGILRSSKNQLMTISVGLIVLYLLFNRT